MLLTEKNIALVVNPFHAKAKAVARQLLLLLQEKGIEHSLFTDLWPANWTDFTEAWVVGGDGTLNHFINRYPQFELPLAVFRGGNGNSFHRILYGSLSTEQQAERVLMAAPQPVDAGLCNRTLFINSVRIGFAAKEAREKRNRMVSHLLASFLKLLLYRPFLCTVNTNDFHWGKKCLLISVANGKPYGGDFKDSPKSLMSDGLLDTHIVGRIHPLLRPRYLPLVEKGAHRKLPHVTYVKSSIVIVRTLQEIPALIDGEPFSAAEFNIECLPGRFLFLY